MYVQGKDVLGILQPLPTSQESARLCLSNPIAYKPMSNFPSSITYHTECYSFPQPNIHVPSFSTKHKTAGYPMNRTVLL